MLISITYVELYSTLTFNGIRKSFGWSNIDSAFYFIQFRKLTINLDVFVTNLMTIIQRKVYFLCISTSNSANYKQSAVNCKLDLRELQYAVKRQPKELISLKSISSKLAIQYLHFVYKLLHLIWIVLHFIHPIE